MTICYVKPVTPSIFLVPLGECVSGALHWKELVELSKDVGFSGPHLVTARPFVVEEHLRKPLGECFFFKIDIFTDIEPSKSRLSLLKQTIHYCCLT